MLTTFPLASPAPDVASPASEGGDPVAGSLFRNILEKLGFPVTTPDPPTEAVAPPEQSVPEAGESAGADPEVAGEVAGFIPDSPDLMGVASTAPPPAPLPQALVHEGSALPAPVLPTLPRRGMDSTLPQAVLESRLLVAKSSAPPPRAASPVVSAPALVIDAPGTARAPAPVDAPVAGGGSVPVADAPPVAAPTLTGTLAAQNPAPLPHVQGTTPAQPIPAQMGPDAPRSGPGAVPVDLAQGPPTRSAMTPAPVANLAPVPVQGPPRVLTGAPEGNMRVPADPALALPVASEGFADPLPIPVTRPARVVSIPAGFTPPAVPTPPLQGGMKPDMSAHEALPTGRAATPQRAPAPAVQAIGSPPGPVLAAPAVPQSPGPAATTVAVISAPPPAAPPPTIAAAVLALTKARPLLTGAPLPASLPRPESALTGKPDTGLPDAAAIDPARPDSHRIDSLRSEPAKPGFPLPPPLARQIADAIPPADGPGFDLSLSPEELGQVRLRLVSVEGGSLLMIQAERPETLDLLRRHIGSLEQDLRDLGHEGLELRFSSGGESQSESRHDPPPSQQPTSAPALTRARDTRETPPAAVAAAMPGRDHLDLRL